MDVLKKILGLVICVIGLGIWGVDYLIFTAIGALTAWIAATVGITGLAVLGVQIVGWILTLGIMLLIFVLGAYVILGDIGLLLD